MAAPVLNPPLSVTVRPVPAPPLAPKRVGLLPPLAFPYLDTGQISSVVFSPDGRRLAFGYGTDAEVTVWNLETGRLDWQRHVSGASGGPILVGPHGRFMVVECDDPDGAVPIWVCMFDGRLIRKLPGYYGWFNEWGAWLERRGRFLVTGGTREQLTNGLKPDALPLIEVWNTRTWQRVDHASIKSDGPVPLTASGRILRHEKLAETGRFLTDDGRPVGKWWDDYWKRKGQPADNELFTTGQGRFFVRLTGNDRDKGVTEVWDLSRRRKMWTVTAKNDCPRVAAISPNGRILAAGSIGGSVEFPDLRTGRLIARTHCATDVIRCLTYSPNGRVLAAAGGNYKSDGVRLLDCANHKLLAVLKAAFPENSDTEKDWTLDHPDWFTALPDLSYVASDSVVKKIRVPGKARDAAFIRRFHRPASVRAALRKCYQDD